MFVVLVIYLSCNSLGASTGLSTSSNTSESDLKTNYMTNKSMTQNSIVVVKSRVVDKESNSTYDLGYNVTKTSDNDTLNEETGEINSSKEYLTFTPKKELPLGMIIAGPAAAVGIMIFLCATYYWHTVQLDRQAKRLSITLFVTPDDKTKDIDAPAPSRSQRLVPSKSKTFMNAEFSGGYNQRRKSTLSAPTTLMPPSASMGKRGSSWSALADQEIINLSAPRRHSTFIL